MNGKGATVAVIQGGASVEREVSVRGAKRVRAALEEVGFVPHQVELDYSLVDSLKSLRPAFAYVIAHGGEGEGGGVQGLLETLEVPFTSSDALTSTVCFNKVLTKRLLAREGIPTPQFYSFSRRLFMELGAASALAAVESKFSEKLVVKPSRGGSSLGIRVVDDPAQLRPAILSAIAYDDELLIEDFVPGREIAVTLLGPAESPRVLPIVEIESEGQFYDYRAHYEFGGSQLVGAALTPEVERNVIDVCKRAYRALRCRDVSRVDLILDPDDNPQVLEINTIPGLTETGPTPVAADLAGMSFDDLVLEISARVAGRVG